MVWLRWRSPQLLLKKLTRLRVQVPDPFLLCPACRHGRLADMPLMDTLTCDFCEHIFSLDVSQPLVQPLTLRIEDAAQPLSWHWQCEQWRPVPRAEKAALLWLWSFCGLLVLIPTVLMGLAVYLFPASGRGAWLAPLWLALTFAAHTLASIWLMAEHYQWPLYQRLKLAWVRQSFQ